MIRKVENCSITIAPITTEKTARTCVLCLCVLVSNCPSLNYGNHNIKNSTCLRVFRNGKNN